MIFFKTVRLLSDVTMSKDEKNETEPTASTSAINCSSLSFDASSLLSSSLEDKNATNFKTQDKKFDDQ